MYVYFISLFSYVLLCLSDKHTAGNMKPSYETLQLVKTVWGFFFVFVPLLISFFSF